MLAHFALKPMGGATRLRPFVLFTYGTPLFFLFFLLNRDFP